MGQLLVTLIVPPIVGVITYIVVRRIWDRDENDAGSSQQARTFRRDAGGRETQRCISEV